jgi:hypothetical protein
MVKTTKAQFKTFVKWCEHYRQKFGLVNWQIDYEHVPLNGTHAYFNVNLLGYQATVSFTEHWTDEVVPLTEEQLRSDAKHEMMHIVTARLHATARERYINEHEIESAEHELVQTLCRLID